MREPVSTALRSVRSKINPPRVCRATGWAVVLVHPVTSDKPTSGKTIVLSKVVIFMKQVAPKRPWRKEALVS